MESTELFPIVNDESAEKSRAAAVARAQAWWTAEHAAWHLEGQPSDQLAEYQTLGGWIARYVEELSAGQIKRKGNDRAKSSAEQEISCVATAS